MKSIFITVRTGSTRLRNKCLLDLKMTTYNLLSYQQIKAFKEKRDNIVLCTTSNPGDDILVDLAKNNDIEFLEAVNWIT